LRARIRPEAVRLAGEARRRGVARVRTHAGFYEESEISALVAEGAYAEFSLFQLTQATQVGLTHVDSEKHRVPDLTIAEMVPRIRAAGDRAVASSDSGIYLLAPPAEAFRQFLVLLEAAGFSPAEIGRMSRDNPAVLSAARSLTYALRQSTPTGHSLKEARPIWTQPSPERSGPGRCAERKELKNSVAGGPGFEPGLTSQSPSASIDVAARFLSKIGEN
jgi:hypothetical protein